LPEKEVQFQILKQERTTTSKLIPLLKLQNFTHFSNQIANTNELKNDKRNKNMLRQM
jgi:hypothetical protein